jgi:hypothetical protein
MFASEPMGNNAPDKALEEPTTGGHALLLDGILTTGGQFPKQSSPAMATPMMMVAGYGDSVSRD